MQCSIAQRLWLLVLISPVILGLSLVDFPSSVVIGRIYTVKWSPQDDNLTDVNLLRWSDNLSTYTSLASNVAKSWTWYVASLPPGEDYVLRVEQGPQREFKSPPLNLTVEDLYVETSFISSASPTITTSAQAQPTAIFSSVPSLAPEAQDAGIPASGLSTGAKAGIGVGATFAAISLACGAFFLGVIVHRRSREVSKDTEDWDSVEKPQLDGKAVYGPVVIRELDARRSMQELHANSGYIPELAADEPRSKSGTGSQPVQSSSDTSNRSPAANNEPISPQSPGPPGVSSHLDSPVSPLSDRQDNSIPTKLSPDLPGPLRRNTSDD